MRRRRSFWINRTMCDVLSDMRKCHDTRNYSLMPGLIEEAQIMANRMESGLADHSDLKLLNDEWHTLRGKVKKLRAKVTELKMTVRKLKKGMPDG